MAMSKATCLGLLALFVCARGCIREYGSVDEAQERAGGHYSYAYNGLDWPQDFAECKGSKQSPILLPAHGYNGKNFPQAAAKSEFKYGALTNPTIVNNGHALQISLPATFQSDVTVPIKGDKTKALATSIITGTGNVTGRVKATPVQFHFHAHSEHIISGSEYALEMHIVHFVKKDQLPACGDTGCPVVLGVMIALTDDESAVAPELRKIIKAMPLEEKTSNTINGTINIDALLPKNRTFLTYEGSLTSPPCTEGLLWHVMLNPIKITPNLLTKYLEAVGDSNCPTLGSEGQVLEKATINPVGPPPNPKTQCQKLANGHNWRMVQPRNNRPIQLAAF